MPVPSSILNNRYRLQKSAGSGGFSEVWLAWDQLEQKEVAVKIFIRQDEEGIRLCQRDFDRTNSLDHDHIIRMLNFGVHEYAPYLVMPYYHKGVPDAGSLEEPALWRIIRDIGSALHYIHNLQPPMIHNDLKPDNILIADDGDFILTDFGISTELADKLTRSRGAEGLSEDSDDDTKRPAGVGPRAYRAPELFTYRDYIKRPAVKATDIWAFGACMFELATSEPPFGEYGGMHQLMHYHDHRSPVEELICNTQLDHFSYDLKNIILRCLEAETWDRPNAQKLVEIARLHLRTKRLAPPPLAPPQPMPPIAPPNAVSDTIRGQAAASGRSYGDYPADQADQPIGRQSLMKKRKNMGVPGWVWGVLGTLVSLGGGYRVYTVLSSDPQPTDSGISLPNNTLTDGEGVSISTTTNPGPGKANKGNTNGGPSPANEKTSGEGDYEQSSVPPSPTQYQQPSPTSTSRPEKPELEIIGSKPDAGSGYHLVLKEKIHRAEAIKIIQEFEDLEDADEYKVWAIQSGFERFDVCVGTFPTEDAARTFHTEVGKDLDVMSILVVKRN